MSSNQRAGRVVIIDDDANDLEFLTLAIRDIQTDGAHVEIEAFADARVALERLGQLAAEGQLPDFAMVDLNMPRMDGRALVKAVRQSNGVLGQLPILMLSTSIASADVVDCYRDGCNAYFQKPLEYTDLVELVGSVMAHWLGQVSLPGRA